MATSLVVEDERGTYTRTRHPHNGYYAGDFGSGSTVRAPDGVRAAWEQPVRVSWGRSC